MYYKRISVNGHQFLHYATASIYEITTSANGCTYVTAPNGMIGLSVVLNGTAHIYRDHQWQKIPPISIYGLIKRPQLIKNSKNFREIAVAFKPHQLQMLIKENMCEMGSGRNVNAYELFEKTHLDQLFESLKPAASNGQVGKAVSTFINKNLNSSKADGRLVLASDLIGTLKVNRVENLAGRLNITSATLRNLFREKIGISPKEMTRLSRIRKALTYSSSSGESFTQLGYSLGYFDQAHFIHDFRSTIGLTPSQYFKQKKLVFDFYNFGRWQGDSFGIEPK